MTSSAPSSLPYLTDMSDNDDDAIEDGEQDFDFDDLQTSPHSDNTPQEPQAFTTDMTSINTTQLNELEELLNSARQIVFDASLDYAELPSAIPAVQDQLESCWKHVARMQRALAKKRAVCLKQHSDVDEALRELRAVQIEYGGMKWSRDKDFVAYKQAVWVLKILF